MSLISPETNFIYGWRFYGRDRPKEENRKKSQEIYYILKNTADSFLKCRQFPQLIQKFPIFYGTRNFSTTPTKARHLSLYSGTLFPGTIPNPNISEMFRNVVRFSGGYILPRRPIPRLHDLPWSAVCECILKIILLCPYYVDRFGDYISFSPVSSSDGESC